MSLISTYLSTESPEAPRARDVQKEPQSFPRHSIEPPELTLTRMFFPMGFPLEVRTNDSAVFTLLARMWGRFEPVRVSPLTPLRFDVYVVDGGGRTDCPPAPVYRLIRPLLTAVADADNYSVVDLATLHSHACLARATLAYPLYAEWFLLAAPLSCISTHLATPIHSACISRGGRGVLLCGESGAGKSTLAYACARVGWVFTADDATLIPHHERGRRVIGNCYQVRFRPSAAELFPEVSERDLTPRAAGKPSIEIPTAELPEIHTAFSADVHSIVFLDRRRGQTPRLDTTSVSVARHYFRSLLFGLPDSMLRQYQALEQMLTAPVYRLRYERLHDAITMLDQLVDAGGT